jgi:mono/diheme cytochrome c family protein
MVPQFWLCFAILLASSVQSLAQQRGGAQINDTGEAGRRLFEQSCGVCHTKPTLASPLFGPQLSRESLGGNVDAMREVISSGTPRMPGFKYFFQQADIDAVVGYLKTLQAPAPEPAAPAPGNPPRVQDN